MKDIVDALLGVGIVVAFVALVSVILGAWVGLLVAALIVATLATTWVRRVRRRHVWRQRHGRPA